MGDRFNSVVSCDSRLSKSSRLLNSPRDWPDIQIFPALLQADQVSFLAIPEDSEMQKCEQRGGCRESLAQLRRDKGQSAAHLPLATAQPALNLLFVP